MTLNLKAAWLMTRHASEVMPAGGAIVNITSVAARRAGTIYGLGKAALESMTTGASYLLAERGIRINAVELGALWTAGVAENLPPAAPSPAGRWWRSRPRAIAGTPRLPVLFLASDQARWISGQVLAVDGGGAPRAPYPGSRDRSQVVTGRVALITGCGKPDGGGQAIARALAADGAAVVVTDRKPSGVLNRRQEIVGSEQPDSWSGLETLVAEIVTVGGTAMSVLGDIGNENDVQAMVNAALARYDRLDILVNNAAAPQGLDRDVIDEIPVNVFDDVIRINLRGTWLMCRAAVPAMRRRRWGRIINISSMAGVIAAPRSTPYSASKAGIIGLTRALSMDVAAYGVTVNAICPGALDTSRSVLSLDPDLDVRAEMEQRGRRLPVGRVGRPERRAAAVRYLSPVTAPSS